LSHRVHTVADLEYSRVGERSLQLDLHRPDGDGEFPCVVYFHGGAWMRGDRKAMMAERLHPVVSHGIAIAAVSYRFTDAAPHPAQLEDGRAAVGWLRANAGRYGLRRDRIGAWGASAGGWIALMLALTATEDPHSSVQAACSWFAVTDLATVDSDREAAGLPLPTFLHGRPLPEPSPEARLLGVDSVAQAPEAATEASPVTHAANAAGPVLLMHGDADGLISIAQGRRMHHALLEAWKESQLLVIDGANHESEAFHTPAVLAAVAGFFQAHL